MTDNQESVMQMFNLPDYTKNKTFAEASKAIADRFKGQDDPDSQATLKELQERLIQAQEFVKQQSEPDATASSAADPEGSPASAPADAVAPADSPAVSPASEPDANTLFLGGLLGGKKEGVETPGAGGGGAGGGGGYAGLVTGAMDLGKTAFGDPNVDTSGATEPEAAESKGAGALKGAAKGAKAGMMFGPWGAAIGGAIGGVAGLVGAGKEQKAVIDARVANTGMKNKETTNAYKKGGKMEYENGGELSNRRKLADVFGVQDPNATPGAAVAKVATQPVAGITTPNTAADILANNKASATTSSTPDISVDEATDPKAKFNPASLLRYAPAAANLGQLASLKKPKHEAYDRLGNVYQENLVDEKSLQNIVGQDVASMRNKIVGASGGSGSTARANLLASQLKGTKALSDAYIKAEQVNRAEKTKGQEFKLNVDKTNLAQSNRETEANAANLGNFETQKSKLIAQLGDDLGGIGKEELLKQYPELMGMDYNQRGEFIAKLKADKEKKNAAKILAKAARKKK